MSGRGRRLVGLSLVAGALVQASGSAAGVVAANAERVTPTETDDNGSILEADIEVIAQAGITLGCDPTGTRFCPDENITRGQMAAFFHRALDR